jgi:hypothetical protein
MFLAVDMFTGYIQLAPLKSRSAEDLITAVLETIIRPFSIPKYFRCDSETAMFSSYEFHAFMEPLGIKFLPCSTGAPWSNGAAERAVQTIKSGLRKFILQEHAIKNWDEYIHFFTSSHNKSTSVYGFAPEELHFGFSNPTHADLFQLWPDCQNQEMYMEKILPSAIEARKIARERQEKAVKDKITYRNKGLKKKIFRPGQIVIQRQLQLATGPGKAMQPKYQGPYVIIEIDKDESSALIEHMHSGQQVRAHFSNISLLNFLPQYHKAPARYEEQLLEFLPEKYSFKKYYPKSISKPIRPISSDGNIETADDRQSSSSMEVNVSIDQDSNLAPTPSTENSARTAERPRKRKTKVQISDLNPTQSIQAADSNPTPSTPLSQIQSTSKDTIIMPSILKTKAHSNNVEKENCDQIIMPQILTNKRQLQQVKPSILMPSILNQNPSNSNSDLPAIPQRRSSRNKKPPDKLRF